MLAAPPLAVRHSAADAAHLLSARKAAELGDPAGQCNLAIIYLQANPPNTKEAIEWLYKASFAGQTPKILKFQNIKNIIGMKQKFTDVSGIIPRMDQEDFALFIVCCWSLWYYRNRALHAGTKATPNEIVIFARNFLLEFRSARHPLVEEAV
ncbi:hypothetical protein CDL12_22114 [Handroanthus impetiginosus]|uniref:Uncharacterized protein n=1 Tax=Handroanthus impetiginosus TaxID=429701 RepID=A0A2G9GJG7_9LAMI|nr:hypothetical protein CDL12_22114 [Handroanthus impetiginosus]